MLRLTTAALIGVTIAATFGASPALAHPLGNFSVNHAHAFRFTPSTIIDHAVLDVAEIPTAQAEGAVDGNGDGTISDAERAAYAEVRCVALVDALSLTVDGERLPFAVTASSFELVDGAAGLATSRLECDLEAEVDLTQPLAVEFTDRFESNRVGWREITAVGDGVQINDSPVPTASTTDSLRVYPVDLLSSPLDVREVSFRLSPGSADVSTAPAVASSSEDGGGRSLAEGGPLAGLVDRVTGVFDDLIGRRDLTLGVGLIAVLLAIVLGASHALLPGHGKTVMAAYIAGRQGTARDAVVVGATVTATHTGGVLLLGLALTVSSALAGETVLAWLGVMSGLLIAGLGGSLLIGTARHRPSSLHHGHSHGGHSHSHGGHSHSHGGSGLGGRGHTHSHGPQPGHDHDGLHGSRRRRLVLQVHPRSSSNAGGTANALLTAPAASTLALATRGRVATSSRVTLATPHREPERPATAPVSRRALVGMGIAGGLVPSPSALIVLLSAIALGRTAFGILLVIGYGVGMAATLTAAGLLLVRVRDRYQRRAAGRAARRIGSAAARWQKIMHFATASLVLLVGLGLALRSLGQLG